jgi:hypothetical protein
VVGTGSGSCSVAADFGISDLNIQLAVPSYLFIFLSPRTEFRAFRNEQQLILNW